MPSDAAAIRPTVASIETATTGSPFSRSFR